MPFGLTNAPATFQRLMQSVLTGMSEFCSVYIDHVLVFSDSVEDHIQHLQLISDWLKKVGLRLHPLKCQFALPEVLYLGHLVSADGIHPSPEKVRAVANFTVVSFWERPVIIKYSSSPPVLVYPDFNNMFLLHTDASGQGLGAVLEQEPEERGPPHPVAFASRSLSKQKQKYGITKLEALGGPQDIFMPISWGISAECIQIILQLD